MNYDNDLFARLIVGERIVEAGIFPYQDFLSYTPTHEWYDHEWGSGVIFYTILKYLKPFGLILLQTIIMFITMIFIIKTQKIQNHSYPKSIIFMSIFAIIFKNLNPNIVRCQIFSFAFFAIFLYILEKFRLNNNTKLIWIIPPAIILWNNLHGGVVAGLGLIFIYFIGTVFDKKNWKKLLAILMISTPLLIINPYGYKYLPFLFSATTMYRKYIVEWWHAFARRHFNYYLPALTYSIIGFISIFIKKRNLNFSKIAILLVTIIEGCAHVKLLSLTVITISALCYNDIYKLLLKFKKFIKKLEAPVYVAIICISLTLIPLLSPGVPRTNWVKFPLKETEFIKINKLNGNLLASFGFGSFLTYKLYPQNLIYIDGRYEEVYYNREFNMLKIFELGEPNWENIYRKYDTNIIMATKNWDVYSVLKNHTEWKCIYEGPIAGIFVKKESVKDKYLEPSNDIMYYRKNILTPNTKFYE